MAAYAVQVVHRHGARAGGTMATSMGAAQQRLGTELTEEAHGRKP